MIHELVQQAGVLEIVGDVIRVRASGVALEDLAVVENVDGSTSPAKVVGLDRNVASLQVFAGGKGLSTDAKVRFLGHSLRVTYSQEHPRPHLRRGGRDRSTAGRSLLTTSGSRWAVRR